MGGYWSFPGLEKWGRSLFRSTERGDQKRLCQILKDFGYPVDDMHRKGRSRLLVHTRRLYMAVLYNEGGHTHAQIASDLRKNHATVIHHVYTMRNLMENYPAYAKEYRDIATRFVEGGTLKGVSERALKNFKVK